MRIYKKVSDTPGNNTKNSNRRSIFKSAACILIFSVLLMTVVILSAFASSQNGYVAEVDSVKYKNYADAWSAVGDGGTVTMLADWNIDKALVVDSGKTVTINMNGFMINRGLSSSKSDGEVFWVKSGAVLNIIGEKSSAVAHKGTIQADMWHYNANGNNTIYGALITGGYSSNGGGAIHIKDNARVNIVNVTIAGNASTDGDGAGAIRLDSSNGSLTITDSEICYNKATDGGGAIAVVGKDSSVEIFGTKINNNIASDSGENGGALLISHGTVKISKSSARASEISFNKATKNGGAVYISNGNLILDKSTIIARNSSGKEGGAVYVDSGADNVEIRGIFSGNSATEEGGAVYVNSSIDGNKGVKISDVEFLGNRSVLMGGAIFVDSDNNIALSGRVIANGNTPNNLYIQKSTSIASNGLTAGSRVGITTSWDSTIYSPIETTNYRYLVSDKMGYEIIGTEHYAFHHKISTGAPESIVAGNNTYPVEKGSFVFDGVVGGHMTAYYYYSDGYFVDSARYYNEHLVTMSISVAMAGVTAKYEGEYTAEKGSKNIVDLFESAGFTNIYVHYPEPEFFGKDAENLSTIGYVIASREITVNGETVTLLAVALRGGSYGAEWASNFVLGDGIGEARGFSDAANQVEAGIYNYIREYGIDDNNSKFWLSGFSRGGATVNLVSKRLTDTYGEDDVYAFCFEAPRGGVYGELKDGLTYCNIHCIINATDIVPYVGPAEMGFIRYGVDHMLPSYQVGTSEYDRQKELMLTQLAAVNPNVAFNDYFNEATISYLSNAIFGSDLISEISGDYDTGAEWTPVFMKKMQEYSMTNNVTDSIYNKDSVNWYGYRNYWSTYKWYLYESNGELLIKSYDKAPDDFNRVDYTVLTIEDSIATIMNFYYGTDGAKKEAIMEAIDLNVIMGSIDKNDIYFDIIGEWNGFSISQKNEQFNKIWTAIKIEEQLASVMTEGEIKELKNSFYVILDFLLDLISDDYDHTSQNLVGTLIYNVSNLFQPHYYDVVCAWARSYDSFYASGDLISPPKAPVATLPGGAYNGDITIELTADNPAYKVYYTLDGMAPDLSAGNCIEYNGAISLEVTDGKYSMVTIKAIAVYNGAVSEVATYSYALTTNAQIVLKDNILRVYNFTGSAYLVLAGYEGDVLCDARYFSVTGGSYIDLNSLSLRSDGRVIAYLVRDLEDFNLLGHPVEISGSSTQQEDIRINTETEVVISSFEILETDDLDYITVRFETAETTAEQLIVALFEKNSKSDFNNVLYFNMITKNGDNSYTFRIDRDLLREVMGGAPANDVRFVLVVSGNGTSDSDTAELLYNESVYTITYHLNGGVNNSRNIEYFTRSTDSFFVHEATREHYCFVGWYTNPYFEGSPVWAIDTSTSESVHLYARWETFNYAVVYMDGVGGEAFANRNYDVPYGSRTPSFGANPTREGYTFVGWDKEIPSTVSGNAVYTAVWQQNHIHTPVLIDGIDPTCSIPGYRPYYECIGCGYFEDAECTVNILDIDAWKETAGKTTAEHTFAKKIRDAEHLVVGTGISCQDAVRFYYGCNDCGAIGTEEWISDIYGEHIIDTAFTSSDGKHYHVCLNEGCGLTTEMVNCFGGEATCTERAKCSVCDMEYGEPPSHRYESTVTAPTCTEGGYTTHICSVCGDTYVDAYTDCLGHDFADATTESPRTCRVCGETEGEKIIEIEEQKTGIFARIVSWIIDVFVAIINFFKRIFKL